MLRFISFLLGKDYESCKSCEILKQQLEITNNEKKDLLDTLLNLMRPKVAPQENIELEPLKPKFMSITRRRVALENSARIRAQASKSLLAATEETPLEQLEREVGVSDAS